MQPMAKPIGFVPVHRAAALLTAMGKPVHPSNLSRYLARFKDIPQRKEGRVRLVDFEALVKHRAENINVIEKETASSPLPSGHSADAGSAPPGLGAAEPETQDAPKSSEANDLSLQLKRIQLRQAELDLAERERQLISAEEVFRLLSLVAGEYTEALVRQEGEVAQERGREAAADFRRRRKIAQAAAADKVAAAAQEILQPSEVSKAADAVTGSPEAA